MAVMGSTATVTHSAADNVNFTFACDPGRQWSPAPAYLEGFPCLESFQRALLCRGNFFISKSWKGSSRHLKPFWARISVCSAEPACRRFSVGVGGGPASVNKVLCGPPSRIGDLGLFWAISTSGREHSKEHFWVVEGPKGRSCAVIEKLQR